MILTAIVLTLAQLLLRDDFEHRLGVVWADERAGCLAIDNASLDPGDEVFVVTVTEGVWPGTFPTVIEEATAECEKIPSGFSNAYRVRFPSRWRPQGLTGAAIGVFQSEVSRAGAVSFRLAPAPTRHLLQFRACTEPGVLRISVWSGHPRPGGRVWSRAMAPDLMPGAPACQR